MPTFFVEVTLCRTNETMAMRETEPVNSGGNVAASDHYAAYVFALELAEDKIKYLI